MEMTTDPRHNVMQITSGFNFFKHFISHESLARFLKP
jgi:hypothetical protein